MRDRGTEDGRGGPGCLVPANGHQPAERAGCGSARRGDRGVVADRGEHRGLGLGDDIRGDRAVGQAVEREAGAGFLTGEGRYPVRILPTPRDPAGRSSVHDDPTDRGHRPAASQDEAVARPEGDWFA